MVLCPWSYGANPTNGARPLDLIGSAFSTSSLHRIPSCRLLSSLSLFPFAYIRPLQLLCGPPSPYTNTPIPPRFLLLSSNPPLLALLSPRLMPNRRHGQSPLTAPHSLHPPQRRHPHASDNLVILTLPPRLPNRPDLERIVLPNGRSARTPRPPAAHHDRIPRLWRRGTPDVS